MYNYQSYKHPKNGVFRCETNEYKLPIGWIQEEKEFLIIGETDLHFIYELKEFEGKLLPIGIHKSRLVKWNATQLMLWNISI